MQPNDLNHFRKKLTALRHDLRNDLDDLNETLRMSDEGGIPADRDLQVLEEELALHANERVTWGAVEAALQRIEAGVYGTCQRCGSEISKERLEAIPYADECAKCALASSKTGAVNGHQ